jgi:hypothetical protein
MTVRTVSTKRAIAWIVVALVAAGGAAGAQGSTRSTGACPAHRSVVLASTKTTRAFAHGGLVYVCRIGGRPQVLGPHRPGTACFSCTDVLSVDRVQLAGRFAAWEATCLCDHGNARRYLVEMSSVYGRPHRRSLATGQLPPGTTSDPDSEGIGPTRALIVTRRGSVAWIARDRYSSDHSLEVWVAEIHERARRVDRDPSVSPTLLVAKGHRLTWRRGQESRSVPFE